MDNVQCSSDAKTLEDCWYYDETQENCGSHEGAGVNCGSYDSWGSWSSWSSCSKTCGEGREIRTRECVEVASGNRGPFCPGSGREVRSCRTANCPVELIGGNGISYGNVFAVNRNEFYGPVCGNAWTKRAANVVCR